MIILNVLSLLLFLFLLYAVLDTTYLTATDKWVNTQIINIQTPAMTNIIIFITNINGIVGNTLLAGFTMLFLAYKKYYRTLLFYFISFSGAIILFTSIKHIVARSRPHSDLIDVINYSFPSGHATLTMTTALVWYFIFKKTHLSSLFQKYVFVMCITWPVFIAFTRVYLNVHWLSDVIAGLALGIFWVTLTRLFFIKNHIK